MKFFYLLIVMIICGCVAQQPVIKQTASGNPEGLFENTSLENVKSILIEGCVKKGSVVSDTSGNQIVCEKQTEGGEAILGQMIVGNSYSTTPVKKARFVFYASGNNVIVTVNQWIETQMAFGQTRKQDLSSNNQKNDMQKYLFSLGAK